MKVALAAAVVVALLASPSEAEPSFQCPQPGTVIAYSDGSSLTFTFQAGLTCRARTKEGLLVPLFAGLLLPGADLDKNQGERLLPLRVGNQIEFQTSGSSARATGDIVDTIKDLYFDNTVKVVGQEKVVTAGGTFDTFVVEWHRQVRGRWLGAWLGTAWLAPDLGATVKFKFETRQGYGREIAYEAASVSLPQGNSVPSARAAPPPESPGVSGEAIKLELAGGTFLVPAQVNGIALSFVLDTGASDVAIPADVVQMLTRAGAISSRDFIGTKTYVLADGSKLPGEAFTLHELTVGSHTIKNVIAHVAPDQGHLLLGQSFLSQLPAWTIDYKQQALVIGGPAGAIGSGATQRVSATSPTSAGSTVTAPRPAPPPVAQPVPVPIRQPAPAAASLPPPAPAPAAQAQPAAVASIPVTRSAGTISGDVAFRCPTAGTFVQYSNGTTLKFANANGLRCAYLDQAFKEREKIAGFADDPKFLGAGLDRLWPLTIGKEQTIGLSVSGGYLNQHFMVLRTETVVTVAGSFDTIVVEQQESGFATQTAKRLFWYAPELGLTVKSTFSFVGPTATGRAADQATGSLIPGDYQAVRIEVPAGK